eukprot:TRINITY_DN47728_c0_g1_i1.p1 TRINITY_DN47728_c0_g1~~TRINITY_DN47728_c0_g1_i1.p1  ORF type:complete len:675 (-),score=163.59 TRINITY_DN47728_c0_g1_i1:58-2082(-)
MIGSQDDHHLKKVPFVSASTCKAREFHRALLLMPLCFACTAALPMHAQHRPSLIQQTTTVAQVESEPSKHDTGLRVQRKAMSAAVSSPKGKQHGGILIALSVNRLQRFGHKCEDEECSPPAKEAGSHELPAHDSLPTAFFQTDSATQVEQAAGEVKQELSESAPDTPQSPVDEGLPAPTDGKEVFPEEKQVMEAVSTAIKDLDLTSSGATVTDSTVDAVMDALEDGVGAQDPTLNLDPEADTDEILADLEDGIGAQDPTKAGESDEMPAEAEAADAKAAKAVAAAPSNSSDATLNTPAPADGVRLSASMAETKADHVQSDARHNETRHNETPLDPLAQVSQEVQSKQPQHVVTSQVSMWWSRSSVLAVAVGLGAAALLGAICLATGFWTAVFFGWTGHSQKGNVRSRVEALSRHGAKDIDRLLPSEGGYDTVFYKPVSSKQLLRLEVRVEGAEGGSAPLTAPLSGQMCVIHSAAVSRQLHDGMPPVPVAFAASCVDFLVTLLDNKGMTISIKGSDVSLFDMRKGRRVETKTFADAPDSWQDFILTHRSAAPAGGDWPASSVLRADGATLEFQECALLVGASITVVGELHRSADGKLALRPFNADEVKETFWGNPRGKTREPWRTSWESMEAKSPGKPNLEIGTQKVLISDDENLLKKETAEDGKLRDCSYLIAG